MALTIPVGYAQVSLQLGRVGGTKPSFVTFGINVEAGPFTEANLTSVFGNFAVLMENVTPDWALVAARAIVGDDGPPHVLFVDPANVNGSKAGSACPANTSWLIAKNTGLSGRHFHGRMFLPGILETVVDAGGFITAGDVTATQTDATAFLTAMTTTPASNVNAMVILHNPDEDGFVEVPTIVTSLTVRNQVATQRRRMR